jgi:uncharacterized protein YjiK
MGIGRRTTDLRAVITLPVLLCAALAAWSCAPQQRGFDLSRPQRVYTLPQELLEVSALTDVDSTTVACLQDEAATLYFYDLREGRITRRLAFGLPGDMEGLTRVGREYLALRSDGLVYRLVLAGDGVQVRDTFRLHIANRNIEGLGYDEKHGRVLVAPKDFQKGTPEARDRRVIYACDAGGCKGGLAPVLELSMSGLVAEAQRKGFTIPMRTTPKGRSVPAMKLRFSSVAVDPVSDHYYLLSAADRILLVIDRRQQLVALHQLDPKLFPKPEGITFLSSGELLISNEGKDAAPNLLRFARN